jgi:hypothetical protein
VRSAIFITRHKAVSFSYKIVNFFRETTQNLESTVKVLTDVCGFFSIILEMQNFCVSIGGEEARDDGQVPGVQGAEGEGVPGVLGQADCAQVPNVCLQKRGFAWVCHRIVPRSVSNPDP